MRTLDIDLVSDVVCPWCAIGFERLRRAMAALQDEIAFEVVWHPFLLNPDIPREGRDMLEHLSAKYGRSAAEIETSQDQIVAAAKALGLRFERAKERRSWCTYDTHRVLAWAHEHGVDQDFNLALFDAYFGAARDPTEPALLRAIAADLGLDSAEVDAILDSSRYAEHVDREVAYYQRSGVTGVPAFIVDGQYLISGAQEPAALIQAFRQIAGETRSTA